jgi:hypothetical protein
METLRKAFRELSIQYLHHNNSAMMARILRAAIKDVMAAMKAYCPAPMSYTDPINLDP